MSSRADLAVRSKMFRWNHMAPWAASAASRWTQEPQRRLHVVLEVHSTVAPSRLRRAMQAVVIGREVLMHGGGVRHVPCESERFERAHAARKEGLPVIAEDDNVGRELVKGKETA